MSGPDGKENCNKFVDILGLRTIFPLFMKTPKKNRRRILTTEEHEGIVNDILCEASRLTATFLYDESYIAVMIF
jgi:beta-catenin-like protein 1